MCFKVNDHDIIVGNPVVVYIVGTIPENCFIDDGKISNPFTNTLYPEDGITISNGTGTLPYSIACPTTLSV
jgi:hypothetical protein